MAVPLPCPDCGTLYTFEDGSPRDPRRRHWPARCDQCGAMVCPGPNLPEAVAPAEFAAIARPRFQFIGRAYERAADFAFDVPDGCKDRVIVAHGVCTKFGLGTAWVEIDGEIVFDPVYQRFYDLTAWKSDRRAIGQVSYTPKELAGAMLQHGYHGAYHEAAPSMGRRRFTVEEIPLGKLETDPNFQPYQPYMDALLRHMEDPDAAERRTVPVQSIRIPEGYEPSSDNLSVIRPQFEAFRRHREEMMYELLVFQRFDGSLWAYDDGAIVALYHELAPAASVLCAIIGSDPPLSD